MFLALAVIAVTQSAGCAPIAADHIYGHDLAAVVPALQSLSRNPGLQPRAHPRTAARLQKQRIAAHRQSEWNHPAHRKRRLLSSASRKVPEPRDLLAAMQESLKGIHAAVELVENPVYPLPQGPLSFPLSGLSGSSDGPVVWRGTVTYAPNHILPVWARVRVTVHEKRIVAADTLKPNIPISALAIRVEDYSGPFQRETKYSDPQQVIGLMPKNTVPAGAMLTPALLRVANDVERGDSVQVIVQIDSARIEAQGIAEDGGPRGSFVTIRNPESGRKFRARVEDRDKVFVLPTSAAGLAVEDPKS